MLKGAPTASTSSFLIMSASTPRKGLLVMRRQVLMLLRWCWASMVSGVGCLALVGTPATFMRIIEDRWSWHNTVILLLWFVVIGANSLRLIGKVRIILMSWEIGTDVDANIYISWLMRHRLLMVMYLVIVHPISRGLMLSGKGLILMFIFSISCGLILLLCNLILLLNVLVAHWASLARPDIFRWLARILSLPRLPSTVTFPSNIFSFLRAILALRFRYMIAR